MGFFMVRISRKILRFAISGEFNEFDYLQVKSTLISTHQPVSEDIIPLVISGHGI
jgi:hypothetical protein